MRPATTLHPPRNERTHGLRSRGTSLFREGLAFLVMIAVLLAAGYLQAGGL